MTGSSSSSSNTNNGQGDVDVKFFNMLDLNPHRNETVEDESVVIEMMQNHPKLCSKKYQYINHFDGDWLYPLHVLCALNASLETIKICYKAYPDAILHHSVSIGGPIHYACYYGAALDVIMYLAKKDINSLQQTNVASGKTPLHLVCSSGNYNGDRNLYRYEILCYLTEKCPKAAEMVDNDGYTPLNTLCTTLNENDSDPQILKMVEDLTEVCPQAGVIKAKDNTWPLWNALDCIHDIHMNYNAIVKDLIVSNVESTKILHQTDEEEEEAMIKRNSNIGTSILYRAIQMETPMSIMKDILRANPTICTQKDSQGRVPLFYVLREKVNPSLSLIQLLVSKAPETIDMVYEDEIPHACAQRLQLSRDIIDFLNPYEE